MSVVLIAGSAKMRIRNIALNNSEPRFLAEGVFSLPVQFQIWYLPFTQPDSTGPASVMELREA